MMHAVIKNRRDALHLIGHVDAYNLESLRDHSAAMGRDGDLSIIIEVGQNELEVLTQQAGGWLDRLVKRGVPVLIRPRPTPSV